MHELIKNADKIRTTPMGAVRIKRNIGLLESDVIPWCVEAVKKSDIIIRSGKNWYAHFEGNVLTINAASLTVITAHKSKGKGAGNITR